MLLTASHHSTQNIVLNELFVIKIVLPQVRATGHEGRHDLDPPLAWIPGVTQKPGLAPVLPSSSTIAQSSVTQTRTVGRALPSGPRQSYIRAAMVGTFWKERVLPDSVKYTLNFVPRSFAM